MAEHSAIKVTIVGLNYAPERSGIGAFTTALSEGLAESGVSVHTVTGYPHFPPSQLYEGYSRKLPVERHNGVLITRVRSFGQTSARPANRFITELTFGLGSSFAHWYRPDVTILVSPAWLSSALASIRARLFGIPTCVWLQDVDCLGGSGSSEDDTTATAVLGRWERSCLLSATTIVVVHERFKRQLITELEIPPARIEVVRNWSPVPPSSGRAREQVRAELGWMPDDVVVLNYGNVANRSLRTIVEASERAAERRSKVRFVLLREGEQHRANTRLDYRAPPPAKTLMETLRAADILLLGEQPGRCGSSVPTELTTYFSTGLPVIAVADESSAVAEEIALSGGGVRIDAANPEALLTAAEGLASTPTRAAALGDSGRRFAAALYSPETAIAAFAKIIDRSVGAKATGAAP